MQTYFPKFFPKQSFGVLAHYRLLLEFSTRAPCCRCKKERPPHWYYRHRSFGHPFLSRRESRSTARVAATARFSSRMFTAPMRNASIFTTSHFSYGKKLFTIFATRSWPPGPSYQILATRFWPPDTVYHILATTSWLPHPGYHILATTSWLPDLLFYILTTTSWLPDPGYQFWATISWHSPMFCFQS